MAMLRAFSTRSRHGYERLLEAEVDEPEPESVKSIGRFEARLQRARSVPARVFGSSRKLITQESPLALPEKSQVKSSTSGKKVTKSTHPLLSLFDARRRKNKPTANPEFARYLEYLKEGGMWDVNANMPVIHYK